jgi:hypothetical protein
MKKRLISIVSAAFAAAIGLSALPASAMPCCSICIEQPTLCAHGCSFRCSRDEPAAAPGHVVYDEAAAVCYAVGG